jgi:hypothetical protein
MRHATILKENLPRLAAKLGGALWPANMLVLTRNAAAVARHAPTQGESAPASADLERAARRGVAWLCHSQDRVGSGGVGSYEFYGFTTGYPEVTGYIIPTMWDYYERWQDGELAERAVRMADWELQIQQPSGGWEGGNEGDGEPPVVFNTGQVIRGLTRTYLATGDEKYLDSAVRAADWIVATQDPDGSWTTTNFKEMKRVYDTYVAAPLARLGKITGNDAYADAARRNCEFALSHQRRNGWFDLCDNSPYFNDRPSTHVLCYTADGLIETGKLLGEGEFVTAGRRTAERMRESVAANGWLAGRFDERWDAKVPWVCLTGSAQLGIILAGLDPTDENATKLAGYLAWVQRLNGVGRARDGALPGSFPIWGTYAPFKYPCWATKYFLDLLHLVAPRSTGDRAQTADGR